MKRTATAALAALLPFGIIAAVVWWYLTMKSKMTRKEFAQKFRIEAAGVDLKGIPLDLLCALADYESGVFSGRIVQLTNNLFSITAGSSWKGEAVKSADGKYTFRKYATWAESIKDAVRLFSELPRYKTAYALAVAKDYKGFFKGIQAAGYGDPGKATYADEAIARLDLIRQALA